MKTLLLALTLSTLSFGAYAGCNEHKVKETTEETTQETKDKDNFREPTSATETQESRLLNIRAYRVFDK